MPALVIRALFALLILITAIIPFGGNYRLFQDAAALPEIDANLNGKIFYVKEGETLDIEVIYTGNNLAWTDLPPGADMDFSTSFPHLIWTPDPIPELQDLTFVDINNPPMIPFGITFNASEGLVSVTVDIIIYVMSVTIDPPDPIIELDKSTYVLGETVHVRITDPYGLCDFGPEPDSPRVSRAHDLSLTAMPELATDEQRILDALDLDDIQLDNANSDLVGSFILSDSDIAGDSGIAGLRDAVDAMGVGGNLDIVLGYQRPDCSGGLPPAIDGSAAATIRIRPVDVSFGRSQYAFGGSAELIVSTGPGVLVQPDPLTVEIFDNNVDPVGSSLTETGSGNSYSIPLPAVCGADGQIIRADYTYLVEGSSEIYSAGAEATLLCRNLVTDQPSYNSNDGVVLTFTDPELNTDPDSIEMYPLSYVLSTPGDAPFEGMIPDFVKENGLDTGIFANDIYLYFKGLSVDDPEPPGHFITFDRSKTATITMTVEGNPIEITVQPFELHGSAQGAGSSSDNPALGAPYGKPGTGNIGNVQLLTCSSHGGDTDTDGLCNNWEAGGSGGPLRIPYNGVTYTVATCTQPAAAGCFKSNHRDIFLEVDRAGTVSSSAITTALESLRNLLNLAPIPNSDGINGIKLHYVVNENIGSSTYHKAIELWGSSGNNYPYPTDSNDFDALKYRWFGTSAERASGVEPSYATFAKIQGTHYVLFAETQTNNPGSSGAGEYIGNDIAITLLSFDTDGNGITENPDHIKGTLMHELGHNLGLYHGGPSSVIGYNANCKPNYPSVMTYIRQLTTAYGTQQYSDDVNMPTFLDIGAGDLYDANIGSNPPIEVLTLGSGSTMSQMIIVWSSDDGLTKPTQIVTKTSAPINWRVGYDPDPPSETPNALRIVITDLGIPGCTELTNSHADQIYGADDYVGMILNMNFRESNPATAGTGFPAESEPFLPDQEFNSTMATEIRVAGIESLNYLIQSIPFLDFRPPYNNASAAGQIKDEISNILVEVQQNSTTLYIDNDISPEKSVVDLIREGDFETAVGKLKGLYEFMDDESGGSIEKDVFSSTTAYTPRDPPAEPIFAWMFDNNIASLQFSGLNKPWTESFEHPGVEQSFSIVTFDGPCEALHSNNITSYNRNCIINGNALTMINGTNNFAFDKNTLKLVIIGEGKMRLDMSTGIAKEINYVLTEQFEKPVPFRQSVNSDTLTLTANYTWYPNHVTIGHDLRNVTASAARIGDCNGGNAAYLKMLETTLNVTAGLQSNRDYAQNFEMVISLTNPVGVTEFIINATGTLNEVEKICVPVNFAPPRDYEIYTAKVFVLGQGDALLGDVPISTLIFNSEDP